jgi:ABC-type bacteriocin/lantibiotic exporter with double-glycine peptidase domain
MMFAALVFVVTATGGDKAAVVETANNLQSQCFPSCGVACTYAVCRELGVIVSLAEVEDVLSSASGDVDLDALSLRDLRKGLESLNVRAASVKTDINYLAAANALAILYLPPSGDGPRSAIGHFVVLKGVRGDEAVIVDLGHSFRALSIPLPELAQAWQGDCLLIEHVAPRAWLGTNPAVYGLLGLIAFGVFIRSVFCRTVR